MTDWAERLINKVALNEHSAAQYIFALNYWSAWYELRYGCSLPLTEMPPAPVSRKAVIDFFNDHMIKVCQGQLTLEMAEPIKATLAKRGFNGRRAVVAPATTAFRIDVLRSIQKAQNLPFDKSVVAEHVSRIQASFRASQATLGHAPPSAVSLEYLLSRLLSACTKDHEGRRDAALILLLSYLSPRQVACLCMRDLLPGSVATNKGNIDAIDITINLPETKRQRLTPFIRVLEDEAIAIKEWGAIRELQVATQDAPFLIRETRVDHPVWLNEVWITKRLRLIAKQAGLIGSYHGAMCTPIKLRMAREHEYFEHSIQARLGRAMRIGISAALNNLERARDSIASAAPRDD
ncbi:hypothetical protein [Xanthomonas hortorum]|uniref:Uncharacterized protein n=1 Tax=Xanthomonas hortorum pv. hederae TaxID=453603 RepID=A0A9X4BVP1_9XANT|nr:hypothetical protein [Xanthomonas hortorum]MDC8640409.1 hypothetical protein [Xanthomonas hortorum pv. hederae]